MSDTPACKNCAFWKKDYGMWTMTGWTGMDRDDGRCHYEPKSIPKQGADFCHNFKRKESDELFTRD